MGMKMQSERLVVTAQCYELGKAYQTDIFRICKEIRNMSVWYGFPPYGFPPKKLVSPGRHRPRYAMTCATGLGAS